MATEALLVLTIFVTGGLLVAWKYPDQTKRRLNQFGTIVNLFYVVLVLAFAAIFLTSGMTLLIVIGALMVTLLVLRIWSDTGSNPLEGVMDK